MSSSLSGAVVVTTREDDPDDPLARALREHGAEVRAWPTLSFREPADLGPLEDALERLAEVDWLAFTSPRAARPVTKRKRWSEAYGRVACVGPSTARALQDGGWPVHVVAEGSGATALVGALSTTGGLEGRDVVFFAGALARPTLEEGLAARGARVRRVETYRTDVLPPDAALVHQDLERGVSAVLFASPSAVEGVSDALGGDLSVLHRVTVVAIGSTTARALRERGVRPIVATVPTLDGLVSACIDVLRSKVASS